MPGLDLRAAFASAASGNWGGAAAAVGQQAIGTIVIRTQVGPPIVIDPFAPAAPGPNPLLAFIRPEVEIRSPSGETFIAFVPYGAPSANYFPWLVAGAVALAVGTITVIAWIARRIG